MKDEIKEILDSPKILMLSYGNYISLDDYVKLKDYITNLQEENERLNLELTGYREAILRDDKLLGLQDCKLRNEKAIEYIKDNCVLSDEWKDLGFCNFIPTGRIKYKQLTSKKVKELLNILGGDE